MYVSVTLLGLYFGDVYSESRSIPVNGYLTQDFANPAPPVALATVFCTVALNMCGWSAARNCLHITLLSPITVRRLLD